MKKKIKESPFTLAQTWKHCLAMWKWVSENYVEGINDVEQLKQQWVKENGFRLIHSNFGGCFFCDYANRQKNSACSVACPGAMVAPRFDCFNSTYYYDTKPKKFYQKLLKMDKKRRRNAK